MKRTTALLVIGLVLSVALATHAEKLLRGVPETRLAPVETTIAKPIRGNFCGFIHEIEHEGGPTDETFMVKLYITPVNRKEYCIVHGIGEFPDENPVILGGTAFVIGNELFMNLDETHDPSSDLWRHAGIVQVRLDRSTLNGTVWRIANRFDRSTRAFHPDYSAGTVTSTSCP